MIRGRAWCFGDLIDTDVMFPGPALRLPPEEAVGHLFEAIRPGWSSGVQRGDVIVAGRSFGVGSARPVAMLLRRVGIDGVFADTMASLFQRNCVNAGLVASAVPGVSRLCEEGDVLVVDTTGGVATNERTGQALQFPPLPPFVVQIIEAGGVVERLRADGYLPAESGS